MVSKPKIVYRYRNRPKKKNKRRAKDKRFPLLLGAGLGAALSRPIENAVNGDYMGAIAEVGSRFTGYNFQSRQVDFGYALMNGYLPIILGGLGTKAMTKIGVNRELKKIPFAGKYIKL